MRRSTLVGLCLASFVLAAGPAAAAPAVDLLPSAPQVYCDPARVDELAAGAPCIVAMARCVLAGLPGGVCAA